MNENVSYILNSINADVVDYILPYICMVSNPKGKLDLPCDASQSFSFELVCYEGTSNILMEKQSIILNKNQDLVISGIPGCSKVLGFSFSEDFKGYCLILTKTFNNTIVEMDKFSVMIFYKNPISINLTNDQTQQYYHYFELIKCAIRRNPIDAEGRIRMLLRSVFYLFSDYDKASDTRKMCRNDQISQMFMKKLEEDNGVVFRENYYAERLNVTKRSLSRAVMLATGHSPIEHIKNQRVIRAKKMIAAMGHNASLLLVAERLGFPSLPSFSRFFKNHTGMTPSEFRNSLK